MITSIKYFDVSQIERGSQLEEIIPTASIHIKKIAEKGEGRYNTLSLLPYKKNDIINCKIKFRYKNETNLSKGKKSKAFKTQTFTAKRENLQTSSATIPEVAVVV